MQAATKIEVKFSRKKMILLVLVSGVFILIGLWFFIDLPKDNYLDWIPVPLKLVGAISVFFFGAIFVFWFKKTFDNKPALIIDDLGLEDRSSLFSAGFILWKDLKCISILEIRKQKMIMLELNNPEQYIQNQHNFIRRLILRTNFKMFGGHLSLSPKGLDITLDQLYEVLSTRIN
jgi:hypothetical protein